MDRNDANFDSDLKRWLDALKTQLQHGQKIFNDTFHAGSTENPFVDYWQLYKKYISTIYDFQEQALDLLYEKINEQLDQDKAIENPQQLYALWLDCCELIYEKLIDNHDYRHTYSHYVNTLLAYMQQMKNTDFSCEA